MAAPIPDLPDDQLVALFPGADLPHVPVNTVVSIDGIWPPCAPPPVPLQGRLVICQAWGAVQTQTKTLRLINLRLIRRRPLGNPLLSGTGPQEAPRMPRETPEGPPPGATHETSQVTSGLKRPPRASRHFQGSPGIYMGTPTHTPPPSPPPPPCEGTGRGPHRGPEVTIPGGAGA